MKKTTLHKRIVAYKKATYALAQEMSNIKRDYGNKTLHDVTCFSQTRIDALCWMGGVSDQLDKKMLPESIVEFMAYKEIDPELYEQCLDLKPRDIRRLLRKKYTTVKDSDTKTIKVNNWQRQVILLENEMKNMDSATKARAIAHLTNSILNFQ